MAGEPRTCAEPIAVDAAAHPVVDGCDTLPRLFVHRCREMGDRTAHREKSLGIWQSHSWAEFLGAARAIGMGLVALGLQRGEVVSILSEDNKEWIYADLGIQCVGGITNGIYPTDSAGQVAYLLRNSGSRYLILENDEQLDKYLEIRDEVRGVRKCIVLDRRGCTTSRTDRCCSSTASANSGAGPMTRTPNASNGRSRRPAPTIPRC